MKMSSPRKSPPAVAGAIIDSATDCEPQLWKTRAQMAERLQVSPRTIDYWAEDGTLPFYKKGGIVRFDPVECAEALNAIRKKSRAEIRKEKEGK